MTRLTWDARDYELGIDRGVLYPQDGSGEAWNGLVSVTETTTETSSQTSYMDGIKYQRRRRLDSFAANIKAFTYPPSFYDNVLYQRRRNLFDLSYRVKTGEDSYKLHLIYNAAASPSDIDYRQSETDPFSWDITTAPLFLPDSRPTSHLIIDSTIAYSSTMTELEDILYGTEAVAARMPMPEEVLSIFEENAIVRVYDNGDGSFTVTGPDSAITLNADNTFEITWPSAVYVDEITYTISSL